MEVKSSAIHPTPSWPRLRPQGFDLCLGLAGRNTTMAQSDNACVFRHAATILKQNTSICTKYLKWITKTEHLHCHLATMHTEAERIPHHPCSCTPLSRAWPHASCVSYICKLSCHHTPAVNAATHATRASEAVSAATDSHKRP